MKLRARRSRWLGLNAWSCVPLLLASFLASASCGGETHDEPNLALELGTGEASFQPLMSGQQVQLVAGTQGGYHVWLSLRAQGFQGQRLRMQLALQPGPPAPLAASDLDVSFAPLHDSAQADLGWTEHVGWPAQLLQPWCAIDKPLNIQATVSDTQGHSASAAMQIVPTAPLRGFSQTCVTP